MTPDEKHFYLRRLHSLSGVIPVGLFLLQHMYGNVLALWGANVYDEHAKFITHQPLIYLLEFGTVFLPLAFHAGLGIYFMVDSKWNPNKYGYARNWGYTLQRITAFITLFYVVFHVLQTRFAFSEAEKEALLGAMQNLFANNKGWLMGVYAVG
ncbi:partial succinate dehydrogenase / fumarate reductase, cytochrome b subunit, partial [Planctomycetaceae bacterium]